MSHVSIRGKRVPGRGNREGKGPVVCLAGGILTFHIPLSPPPGQRCVGEDPASSGDRGV